MLGTVSTNTLCSFAGYDISSHTTDGRAGLGSRRLLQELEGNDTEDPIPKNCTEPGKGSRFGRNASFAHRALLHPIAPPAWRADPFRVLRLASLFSEGRAVSSEGQTAVVFTLPSMTSLAFGERKSTVKVLTQRAVSNHGGPSAGVSPPT